LGIKIKQTILIPFLLLFTIGFSVYFHSLTNPFVLDDEEQIVVNPMVHSTANIIEIFKGSTMNSGDVNSSSGIYYKPIMGIAYTLLWDFFGNEPIAFHLLQLSIHIINSLLVFILFRYFFSQIISFGFALLFLVHPVNSENVLYCANLQDVLYLFFGLLATLMMIRNNYSYGNLCAKPLYAKNSSANFHKKIIIGGCLLLSLLSKESGILFILLNIYLLFSFESKKNFKQKLTQLTYILVPLVIYFYLRIGVAHLVSITPPIVKIGQASLAERLFTLPKILFYYLFKVVYPFSITLVQDWVVTEFNWLDFVLPLIVVTLFVYLTFKLWRVLQSKLAVNIFMIILILGLGLHSQLIPLDGTVATRWFYFPMIGLFGLLALFLEFLIGKYKFLQTRKFQNILILIFGVKIIFLSVLSYSRADEWKTAENLYEIEVERQPDLYFMQNNLGVELYRRGRVLEAHKHFERATQLAPTWSVAWNNLGSSTQALGDLDAAEKYYLKAIDLSPYYMAYENYALLLYKQKKITLLKAFLEEKAFKTFANNARLNSLYQQLEK
jgi:tetratricopeptide (TPR) repeat protein